MIARLYSNENFPLPVVMALREFGHDVLTSLDAGKANESIPDDDVLRFAIEQGRAVITHNRQDFIRIHRTQSVHEGIIVCTVDRDFVSLAQRIHRQLSMIDSLKGELIRVNRDG